MSNILEINNWNQLTSAKADNPNLKIYVSQYNTEELKGTKVQIIDYQTNDTYLTIFPLILESTILPAGASIDNPHEVVDLINSYGFNIRISEPEVLSENVLTILRGLYASGYRYIYRDYIKDRNGEIIDFVIYASDQIKLRKTGFNVKRIPNFIEDEWDWCLQFKTYPIEDLIENGTVDNGVI